MAAAPILSMESTLMGEDIENKVYNDPDAYMRALGTLLTRERKKKNLSQAAVGKQIGISQRTMSDLEKGENPTIFHYINYANVVGVDFAVMVAKARVLISMEKIEPDDLT